MSAQNDSEETGCSADVGPLWPTPRAYSYDESHTPGLTALDISVRGQSPDKKRYWPTPRAEEAAHPGRVRIKEGQQMHLSAAVREDGPLWPTPSASDGMGSCTLRPGPTTTGMAPDGAKQYVGLNNAVKQATLQDVPAASTWSSAGHLASRLRQLVSAVASPTTDGCGARLCASSATSAHGMPYWKTPQGCLAFDTPMGSRPLDEYSMSFPRWGTVSAGESGVPVMSALRTDVSASSSWADEQTQWSTPRCAMASMYAEDDETLLAWGRDGRDTLAKPATRTASTWPTPTSAGEKLAARPTQGMAHRPGRVPGNLLEAMARELWPSPRASDGAKGGPNMRGRKGDLMLPSAAVQAESESVLWRPPQHRDYRTGMANRNGRMLGDVEAPLALSDQAVGVENWATPTVNTAKNNGAQSQHQRHGPCLDVQAAQWRSPNAYDGQQRHNAASTRRRMEEGKTLSLGGQVVTPEMGGERTQASSGQLNPAFVEILQGFPVGWTAVAPHPSPRRRKACKKKD